MESFKIVIQLLLFSKLTFLEVLNQRATSVGERQKTRGELREERVNRTKGFYQITSSSLLLREDCITDKKD